MGVPGVKAALDRLGLHGGVPRPPLAPLPEGRREQVRKVLETAELVGVAAAR
jgi:dihydrodipicolinate synthase/N-acetylneuraminate lyase